MLWPSPKEFADAVRNPAAALADADLAAADTVLGADGRPETHPGNTSSVYQLCHDDGRSWAVKCFNRIDDSRVTRYAALRAALPSLPFAVGFDYLPDGALVAGRRWPVLKMDWVEGAPLNQVAKDRAGSPAVLDGLFRRWVQLSRELRTNALAHGDLQHANILLVQGKWPGSYTLKLVDYDVMYAPDLADTPSYEVGHPNYQHPERNERSYSPDLDRFPLLVIGTALKALAVHGPDLWKRFDTKDNLLFTAADFRTPSSSRLLAKLCRSENATVRALAGKLVLACGQPLSFTPWLDELCANGEPAISAEETRAVEATFKDTALKPVAAPVVTAPVVASFDLDEEEPIEAAVVEKPKPARRKPLTPVPVVTEDEDEDEPRPRKRSRRAPEPAGGFPLLAVLGVLFLMLLVGGAVAGVLVWRAKKADEAAQQPTDPQPRPEPDKPSGNGTGLPLPDPGPVEPPKFRRAWAKPLTDVGTIDVRPFITADGRTVYASMNQRVEVYDAATGEPGAALRTDVPLYAVGLWSLDRGRVATFGWGHRVPRAWDAKTGDPLPQLARDPLPVPAPPGVAETGIECQVSANGRYVFAGYQGPHRAGKVVPVPYRLVEVATGRVVVGGDWMYGTARFTGDSSKLLIAESNGRVRWVTTATGETEIEWAFDPATVGPFIGGVSADGSLFLYSGRVTGLGPGHYLMDGKTGQPLRRLDGHFAGNRGTLTADGRYLVAVTNDLGPDGYFVALLDARTGQVLVCTPLEGQPLDFERAAFTPDGRTVALHHRRKNELQVYELRGVPPPPTADIPTPLGPIPPRAQPAAVAVNPPPKPPAPGPNGLPAAEALKSVWKATAGGIPTNGAPYMPMFTPDGKTVVVSGGVSGTIYALDAKTGAVGTTFEGHKRPGGVNWLALVGNDRVASGGFDGKSTTWDVKTGKEVDAIKFAELPVLPPGRGHAGITYAVSPTGRYTVQARREAGPKAPGPLRILDTTTDKTVVSADWNGGQIVFTADESRVLVQSGLGKATWYKLPSGEEAGGWAIGEGRTAEMARVLGVSADGEVVLFHGPLTGQPVGVYLLEGKTGRVSQKLNTGAPYQPAFCALSPDGKYVAMSVVDFGRGQWHVDVFAVDGWKLVGRASPEKPVPGPALVTFSPDGKSLCAMYPPSRETVLFALPE